MKPQNHYFRNAVIFAICLAAVFVLPVLGLALGSELLFFAPQLLFPYDHLIVTDAYNSRSVISEDVGRTLNLAQWGLVGAACVWFGRRLTVGRALVLCVGTIIAVGLLSQLVLRILGVGVSLDGP